MCNNNIVRIKDLDGPIKTAKIIIRQVCYKMKISNLNKKNISLKIASSIYIPRSKGSLLSLPPSFGMMMRGDASQCSKDSEAEKISNAIRELGVNSPEYIDTFSCYRKWNENLEADSLNISENRIIAGMRYGLIDHVNGAILKTKDGWVNEKGNIVITDVDSNNKAKIDEYISNNVNIIPFVTKEMAASFVDNGVVSIKDDIIAERVSDSEDIWKIKNGGVIKKPSWQTDEDFVERVLEHSNKLVFISKSVPNTLFHGTISKNPVSEYLQGEPQKTSRKGAATYTTKSLFEAVTTYANPMSLVNAQKREASEGRSALETEFKHSHLHVMSDNGKSCIYHAEMFDSVLTNDKIPSPHALKLAFSLAEQEVAVMLDRIKEKIYLSANTYEVYAALNSINEVLLKTTSGSEIQFIPLIMSSIGYDGIDISFPDKELMLKMKSSSESLEDGMPDDLMMFKCAGIKNKGVKKFLDEYISCIESSIPPNAKDGHVLFFCGTDGFEIKKSIELQTHKSIAERRFEKCPFYDAKEDGFLMIPESENIIPSKGNSFNIER